MSKLYFDLLTEEQKKVLEPLKAWAGQGVLAGGTGLALQLGHRKSYDFDIFYPSPIQKTSLLKVKKLFGHLKILVDTSDELSFITPSGVKISYIHYPFNPLYKMISAPFMRIYNWKDIGLDKAYTIGRRGEWRDYIDLYFCIRAGFTLKNITRGTKRKFKDLFSEKLFLSQLCYLGDIQDFSIDFVNDEVTPLQLQKFFKKEVKQLKPV